MIATGNSTKEEGKISATAERFCRRFSQAEVQLATQDFSEAHLIGTGGFGKVYKGLIDNRHQTVAIKRLAPNSNQGEGEFLMEIETLSKLRHVNLVSLIGYCSENGEMILVYEYIPRGTLAGHLYNLSGSSESDDCSTLPWKQRLNICIGAARGIDYLHTGTSIIHRDVKSTNILLDENLVAKVSDFGLAKHLSTSSSKSYVSTLVKGSFGYLDPDYFITCRLTQKSDTYAFGVVLLEVLCGRPAVDQRLGEDEMSLTMWAQEKISKGKADQIVASNLRDEISADCLKTFVGMATKCLNHEPKKRPTMARVVAQLEFALEQQDRKAVTHNASLFFPLSTFWNRVKLSVAGNPATGLIEERTDNMFHVSVPAIPLDELNNITNNFSSNCLIGVGSNGSVYHGALKCGHLAAIKKLINSVLTDEFLAKHENVARILGYCVDGGQQFLVYEFAQNGSLHDILHGRQGINGSKPTLALSWAQRVEIAMGTAKGLQYIYDEGHVHYNIRSSNILLFDDYQVVKLAYWPSFPSDGHNLSKEYMKLNRGRDVYSFGVVLLQLLTGRGLVVHALSGKQHLVKWATPLLGEHKVKEIVDARLKGRYPPKAVAKMAAIAASCVQREAEFRPDMNMVVRVLNDLAELQSTHLV